MARGDPIRVKALAKRALVVVLVGLGPTFAVTFVHCGSSSSSPCESSVCVQAKGDDAGTLAQCAVGAWLSTANGKCSPIPCTGKDGGPPECDRSDCTQTGYLVLGPTTGYEGSYIVSAAGGTWSGVIAPERLSYAIQQNQILYVDGAAELASCTQQELVLGQLVLRKRAPEPAGSDLQALVSDGGVWIGRSYP
jgi:hypothetical protein